MCGPIDYGAVALSMHKLSPIFAVAGTLKMWKMGHFLIQKIRTNILIFVSKPSVK